MTKHDQNQNVHTNHGQSFRRLVRALCFAGAFGGVIALGHDAQAEQQCTSKPAVCALNKSKQTAPKAKAPVETKQVVHVERCTSKPAVCALQGKTEPKAVVKAEVVRKQSVVPQCTSKPAVCAMQAMTKAKNQD